MYHTREKNVSVNKTSEEKKKNYGTNSLEQQRLIIFKSTKINCIDDK